MPDKFPQGANAKVGGPMHPTHPPWLALWGIVALQTLAHSIGGLGQALDATYCGLLLKWPMVNLPAPHPWGCAQAFQLGNQARGCIYSVLGSMVVDAGHIMLPFNITCTVGLCIWVLVSPDTCRLYQIGSAHHASLLTSCTALCA